MTTEKDAEVFGEAMARVFGDLVDRWSAGKREELVAQLIELAASGDPRARDVAQAIRAFDTEGPWGTVRAGAEVREGAISRRSSTSLRRRAAPR